MVDNRDIRTIIDPFLDVPSLNSLLLAFKAPQYNDITYSKYVKKMLREKKKVCKHHWHYHLKMPDKLRSIKDLHVRTRENIENLRNSGYVWQDTVNSWIILRKRGRKAYDMMLRGYHPEKGIVQYWRHETKSPGAGQTMLFWDEGKKRKRIQVSCLLAEQNHFDII